MELADNQFCLRQASRGGLVRSTGSCSDGYGGCIWLKALDKRKASRRFHPLPNERLEE